MSTNQNAPKEIIIDGVKISSDLIQNLKDLQNSGPSRAKDNIARNCLFISSLPGDCEHLDRLFFFLQQLFYQLLMSLNNDPDEQGDQP